MLVEFLHLGASRAEVFTWIKLSGLLVEDLAYGSSHSETAVRVNIDLAYIHLGSFAELFFRNANSVGKFASILVNNLNIFLWN